MWHFLFSWKGRFIMKIIQSICTQSDCYKAGRTIAVKGLMLHSVGCPQPKAQPFINNWNKPGAKACVHAIVEPDGEVYQLLPWNHRGWHGGGNSNNTHIGVEMTEPDTIRYTGGSSWEETGDGENTKAHVLATYKHAVELFAYLCNMFSLDPLEDGVILSHSEGHKRGIASNHGDVKHLWRKFGLSMTQFRQDVRDCCVEYDTNGLTSIMGTAVATAEQMENFIREKNPNVAQSVIDMIPLYLIEGEAEGVRGDIAFAQSCLETGNFTFDGSAVTLDQNNFCGMGVTSRGKKGCSFETPLIGIRAQIQHLKAYATEAALVNDCVDSRFRYVARGCASFVEWLGQKENPNGKGWATGKGYGSKILTILENIAETKVEEKFEPYKVRVKVPNLNIRKGPGTDCAKTGRYTGVGIFTIIEEADGKGATKWGRLKSRAGWISLDYVTKC